MAKIIKVGSQNPTFTSTKTKKATSIQTYRNSNEATNPFKFTNFEGNTLQFADVFEGFKPSFKATPMNRLRMIASSTAGSMHKIKSGYESIVSFVKRIGSSVTRAWDYATTTSFTAAMADATNKVKENKFIRQANEMISKIPVPSIGIVDKISGIKDGFNSGVEKAIDFSTGMKEKWNSMVSNISIYGKNKYMNMPVADIKAAWIAINEAEGGIA